MVVILFFLTCSLIFTYLLSNKDYLNPAFLMTAGFFISYLCTFYMNKSWNVTFNLRCILAVIIGLLSFYIGYFFTQNIFFRNKKRSSEELKIINVKTAKIVLLVFIGLISNLLYIRYIRTNVGGSGNWTDMIARYRFSSAYSNQSGTSIEIPFYISSLRLFANVSPYLFIYIAVNNYLITKKWDVRLIIAIYLGLVSTMIGGSRLDFTRIPIAWLFTYYLLKRRTYGFNQKGKLKLLLKIIVVAILIVFLFSELRSFVGRTNTSDFTTYIAQYLGAPNVNLNDYFEHPLRSEIWGKETFWGINNFIGKLTKNNNLVYDYTLEFRTHNGFSMGNVYSAFRMYYADFNFLGIIILDYILGAVFCNLYYVALGYRIPISIKKIRIKRKRTVKVYSSIIAFSVFAHSVVMMFYADWFYSQNLSWLQLKFFIWLYLLKIFFVDTDIKNRV